MTNLKQLEIWFITGSQHLYGEETLKQVAEHSKEIAAFLDKAPAIPVRVVFKPTVKTPEEIYSICREANTEDKCIGIITWMHTFSPAKMWINGLKILQKPLLHLHTQFNRDIPWSSIDMDFMNLNQSAHGDREFGFIMSRMRLNRKVVVGHWQDSAVLEQINAWSRAAAGWNDWQGAKFARFGDNMRSVAVTEGDKVEAEIKFGYSVKIVDSKSTRENGKKRRGQFTSYGDFELPCIVLMVPSTAAHRRRTRPRPFSSLAKEFHSPLSSRVKSSR